MVKINDLTSNTFPISIGLRQGCNLSPYLFNLYVNDLPKLLQKAECDPVHLSGKPINILMYADDMLILSKSAKGLNRALHLIHVYCNKWQLLVNVNKTKVIVFFPRRKKEFLFKYGSDNRDIVDQYQYLGLLIHKSGSFTSSLKNLKSRAVGAYYAMKKIHNYGKIAPHIHTKLFDTLVRPILLYSSEVWGAFGLKFNQGNNSLVSKLLSNETTVYEKLNLKMCKHALQLPKRASNLGCRA